MADIRTTKTSSRNHAHTARTTLEPHFENAGGGQADRIVLASLKHEFDDVTKRARRGARLAGMMRSDVASAIAAVRSR